MDPINKKPFMLALIYQHHGYYGINYQQLRCHFIGLNLSQISELKTARACMDVSVAVPPAMAGKLACPEKGQLRSRGVAAEIVLQKGEMTSSDRQVGDVAGLRDQAQPIAAATHVCCTCLDNAMPR